MTESFAELFEASQANLAKLKPGSIVTGTVVEVRGDVVVINAGLKSEGIVPIEQFRNDAGEIDVGVGDQVKVALDSIENGFGETVLSREKAKRAMVWDELEEALEKNETIPGRISGSTTRASADIDVAPSTQAASSSEIGTESMKFFSIQIAMGSDVAAMKRMTPQTESRSFIDTKRV